MVSGRPIVFAVTIAARFASEVNDASSRAFDTTPGSRWCQRGSFSRFVFAQTSTHFPPPVLWVHHGVVTTHLGCLLPSPCYHYDNCFERGTTHAR